MPEQDRERLSGDTVQERDDREIAEVRAMLGEHVRIRAGLPPKPIFKDVDVIPPVTGVPGTSPLSGEVEQDGDSEKITPIQVHIRRVREELTVAQELEDPISFREIKKKAA